MRKTIAFAFAFAFAFASHSEAQIVPVSISNTNCALVSVSSTTPTEVVVSTTAVPALSLFASIQNQDATNPVYCSQSASVAISGANTGWKIAFGTSQSFTLPVQEAFYCLAGTAAVNTVICINK